MRMRPYESAELRAVTGPAIRPGDADLSCRAARYCGLGAGERVLDVGCGAGATLAALRCRLGSKVVGLEPSLSLLAEARRNCPDLTLIRGDALALPFGPRKFGALFCECVLSLVADPSAALAEFRRVLLPGGHVVVADLYRRKTDGHRAMVAAGGCLRGAVGREVLGRWVEGAGFAVQVWEDHTPLLKTLAARLAWAGVSMGRLWGLDCNGGPGQGIPRMGYFLLVARKRKDHHG